MKTQIKRTVALAFALTLLQGVVLHAQEAEPETAAIRAQITANGPRCRSRHRHHGLRCPRKSLVARHGRQ